jgi:hypothetical protein
MLGLFRLSVHILLRYTGTEADDLSTGLHETELFLRSSTGQEIPESFADFFI